MLLENTLKLPWSRRVMVYYGVGLLLMGAISAVAVIIGASLGVALLAGLISGLIYKCLSGMTSQDKPSKQSLALIKNMPNIQQSLSEGQVALSSPRTLMAAVSETDEQGFEIVKKLLIDISTIDLKSPGWQSKATVIRATLEGREQALIEVIKKHGEELTHALAKKVEMGDQQGAQAVLEGSLLRKLYFICHPDKWKSEYAKDVLVVMLTWVEGAKDTLEKECLRAEHSKLQKELLREMNEYIKRAGEYIRRSGDMMGDADPILAQIHRSRRQSRS